MDGMNDETRWLDDTEQRAWMSLLAVVLVGFPELERTFRPHGLVHVEYGLLAALSNEDEGLRLSELAAQMNMSQSRLSHRMRKLVDLGYVEVTGDACDGRVSIARVTEAGRRFAAQVSPPTWPTCGGSSSTTSTRHRPRRSPTRSVRSRTGSARPARARRRSAGTEGP